MTSSSPPLFTDFGELVAYWIRRFAECRERYRMVGDGSE